MRSFLLILSFVVAALLTACGSSGDAEEAAPSQAATIAPVDAVALARFLLQVDDMPTGYSAYVDETEGDGDEDCFDIDNPGLGAIATAAAGFRGSGFEPIIAHWVLAFRSRLEADAAMKALRTLIEGPCASVTDSDGQTTKMAVASYPKIGDETLAANISVSGGFLSASGRLVIVRKGQFVSVLAMAGLLVIDASPLEALARKAAAKLP